MADGIFKRVLETVRDTSTHQTLMTLKDLQYRKISDTVTPRPF